MIAVHERLDLVRGRGFHEYEAALGRVVSLRAEKYTGLIIDASICHGDVGLDPFLRPPAVTLSFELVNHDGGIITLIPLAPVTGDKQRILVREVYTSFVRKWQVIFDYTSQSWRSANNFFE